MPITSLVRGVPQSKTFGGRSGPYIGTLGVPPPPAIPKITTPSAPAAPATVYSGYTPPTNVNAAPGTDKSYETSLLSHPNAVRALGTYNAAIGAANDSLRGQIQRAIIQSGYVPNNLQDELGEYANYVDEATRATAASNPTSQRAQLDEQVKRGLGALNYNLAARGSGSSGRGGAQEFGSNDIGRQAEIARSQQLSALSDALFGGLTNQRNAIGAARGAYDSALGGVASLLAQNAVAPETEDTIAGGEWTPMPQPGELAPPGYAPIGSTVAPSAGSGTYTVGGIQIQPPAIGPVPTAKKKKAAPAKYDPLSSIWGRG